MMVYGYSDDSTGFIALATGSGHAFRAVEARAGRPVITNEMETAMDAAERVDDAFMDETTCVSMTAPPKVFELNGIPDNALPAAFVLAFAAAFDAAASLHPNPTPALFQQYVHDDTAAGLQTTLAATVLPHPADSGTYTTPEPRSTASVKVDLEIR